jgi:glucoselysine-6-phosphate deglycase
MMTVTMYDYINEQAVVLPKILEKRAEIAEQFLKVYNLKEFKRVVLIATGSSYNEAVTARYFMEKYLQKEVQVKYPYTFTHYETTFEPDTLMIGISQSGRSTSTLDAMKKAQDLGFTTAAVTANAEGNLARAASHAIIVPCGNETVGYVTLGFTSTVLTLMLMALEAAYAKKMIQADEYQKAMDSFRTACANIEKNIVSTEKWYERNKSDLLRADRMMVVGYGSNFGTALEGCLKVNETVRCAVSSYELEEFMHGPYLELDKNSYVFFIASQGAGEERIKQLQRFVDTVTPHNYTFGHQADEKDSRNITIAATDNEDISPIDYIIPFQVLAYRLSVDKGVDLGVETFPEFNQYVHSKVEKTKE